MLVILLAVGALDELVWWVGGPVPPPEMLEACRPGLACTTETCQSAFIVSCSLNGHPLNPTNLRQLWLAVFWQVPWYRAMVNG